MLSCLAPLFLAATLGQAPDQADWLKSIPADVAVVARVKAPETVRDDLMKMLEAMSGNAAALARPQIEQGLAMMEAQSGKPTTQHPFFVLMTLPKDGPMPGWIIMVESDSYEGVIKSVSKKEDFKPKGDNQIDTFDGQDGQPWFSTKGKGFVAFGPDEALIKSVAKPAVALAEKISEGTKTQLLGGDLGVYVNVAVIQAQYADQIEQGKQALFGLMDQGGQLDAKTLESAKIVWGGMFDSLKSGDSVAFNLDFSAAQLGVSGAVTVKADSASAKRLATAKSGSADLLGKLPADATVYAYSDLSPEAIKGLTKLGMSANAGAGATSPEMEKAAALMAEAGVSETYAAMFGGQGGLGGMSAVSFSMPKDPAKAVEAARMSNQAMKAAVPTLKDVVVTPKAETYKGFTLDQVKLTYDLEKMTPPNSPGGVEGMKKLMGGDTITGWYGTDGKMVVNVAGKSLDDVKARIDSLVSGENSVAKTTAVGEFRSKLAKKVTALGIVNAQGMVKFVGTSIGAMTGHDVPVPSDMPKEAAFLGGSLTASPTGYQFQFIVPSNVGPVLEKGLVPMLQGLGGVIQ